MDNKTENKTKVVIEYDIVDKKTGKVLKQGQLTSIADKQKGEKK